MITCDSCHCRIDEKATHYYIKGGVAICKDCYEIIANRPLPEPEPERPQKPGMINWYQDNHGEWHNVGSVVCHLCYAPATGRVVPFGKLHEEVFVCNIPREVMFAYLKSRS